MVAQLLLVVAQLLLVVVRRWLVAVVVPLLAAVRQLLVVLRRVWLVVLRPLPALPERAVTVAPTVLAALVALMVAGWSVILAVLALMWVGTLLVVPLAVVTVCRLGLNHSAARSLRADKNLMKEWWANE